MGIPLLDITDKKSSKKINHKFKVVIILKFNTKIKVYPDGNFKATYCNKLIFKDVDVELECSNNDISRTLKEWKSIESTNLYELTAEDLEQMGVKNIDDLMKMVKQSQDSQKPVRSKTSSEENLERSIKRAKETIFDMAYINDFKYFVTINFDQQKVNSRNVKETMAKLRNWLSNSKQRLGMEYILVPEYHPNSLDGSKDRIHCHMLITDYPKELLVHAPRHIKGGSVAFGKDGSIQLMYSQNGQPIYNMLGWKYGFSTCIPIYSKANNSNFALAHYISKYITKDVKKIFGKFYWSSKGLKRDVDTYYFIEDYESLPLKEYEIPNTNLKLKYDSQFDFLIGSGGRKNEKEKQLYSL